MKKELITKELNKLFHNKWKSYKNSTLLKNTEKIKIVEQLGYDAILMGTSLMKSKNPGKKLERIIKEL